MASHLVVKARPRAASARAGRAPVVRRGAGQVDRAALEVHPHVAAPEDHRAFQAFRERREVQQGR